MAYIDPLACSDAAIFPDLSFLISTPRHVEPLKERPFVRTPLASLS